MVNSKILYSYELSRRHLLLAHEVYNVAFKMSYRDGSPLSAFDVLLLSMGLDLSRVHGYKNLWVVTTEGAITDVCEGNKGIMPQVINLANKDIPKSLIS